MRLTATYDTAARSWDRKAHKLGYSAAYKSFFEDCHLPAGRVLDIGTGTGTFARAWVEAGGSPDLTLLEPSAAMIARAQRNFAQIDLYPRRLHCGFESLSSALRFDAILASHVLEHFPDATETMRQFEKLLSPGGQLYLIVSKPHWCNWLIWLRFRHRWFAPDTICQIAKDAGLSKLHFGHFPSGPPSRTSLGYVFLKP